VRLVSQIEDDFALWLASYYGVGGGTQWLSASQVPPRTKTP